MLTWCLLHPGVHGIVGAPHFKHIRHNVFEVLEEQLALKGQTRLDNREWENNPIIKNWNRSEYQLDFTNGSRVYFISLDDGDIDQGTVNFVWVDEARKLESSFKETWDTLTGRLRRDGPQGGWVTTHSPTKEIVDEFGPENPNARIYRWSIKDAYEAGVIGQRFYEDQVSRYHGAKAKARLEGKYARPEGLVYDRFDPSHHVVPRPDPPIDERGEDYQAWARFMSYGVDWGYTHATCITAISWSGSTAHAVDEWWRTHRTIADYIEAAQEMVKKWGPGVFWCGPDKPGHISDFQDAGLDARELPSDARKVADGTGHLNTRFQGDELLIAPGLERTLEEIDMYEMDEEKDEPKKDAPDAMDALRYGVYGQDVGGHLSMGTVDR